ncbi:MAG: YmdB family metallophosphoesterase, partial [Terriglobales bacterium]
MRPMRILFIGDIFGSPGRKIVRDHLADIVAGQKIDLVIANAENAAGGFGVTPSISEELLEMGIEVLTTGNHVWDKKEIIDYMRSADGDAHSTARRLLRPANYPAGTPGVGVFEGSTRSGLPYAVLNLQGRVFMAGNDDPFRTADALLTQLRSKVIVVDMHAEATS